MEEKKKHKVMIGIEVVLLCMLVTILGTNAASSNPPSNGVSYGGNNQTTVEGALNDLYNKANYGNATAAQILKGKTALVGGKKVTGTYVAPTCPSLASQTQGDAKPENLDKGKIAWVNGKKIIGIKQIPLADKVRLGDYVRYTPNKTSYALYLEMDGNYLNMTFKPSELNIWRVIKKNNDGTLELVTEHLPSSPLTFGSSSSSGTCKTYVGILNAVAHAYENYEYTISSRAMGYNGVEDEYIVDEFDDQGPPTDIELVKTAIGTLEAKRVDVDRFESYWLASRASVKYGYFVYTIQKEQNDYSITELSNGGAPVREMRYVRPIVVLRSNLKITGGNGTVDSPYTLGL